MAMLTAALFTTARTWKQPKCPSTEDRKKDVVHIYNGLLLSHIKEWNWIICRDVDGPRQCHTQWSKSRTEKQITYINGDTWNLENGIDDPFRKAEIDTWRTNVWIQREKGRWDELGHWHLPYALLIPCIKRKLMRTYCIAWGTLLKALLWPEQEENIKGRGYRYLCDWFILLYGRN